MNPALVLHPTGAGLLLAAAAVVFGAPLFSDGLRALRLRRQFARLKPAQLADSPTGFVHVHGRVALESPMFAPLSGGPCAGFVLDVHAAGSPVTKRVKRNQPFRLIEGGVTAHVLETGSRWELPVSAERTVRGDQALSENLDALLAQVPEAQWARRTGATLHLTERALKAGAECHVIGIARHARSLDLEREIEWARTGTDDAHAVAVPLSAAGEPDLWIGSGEHLDFLLVTDRAPAPARLSMPLWRTTGVVLGPAFSMAGLYYLANALDLLRSLGNM